MSLEYEMGEYDGMDDITTILRSPSPQVSRIDGSQSNSSNKVGSTLNPAVNAKQTNPPTPTVAIIGNNNNNNYNTHNVMHAHSGGSANYKGGVTNSVTRVATTSTLLSSAQARANNNNNNANVKLPDIRRGSQCSSHNSATGKYSINNNNNSAPSPSAVPPHRPPLTTTTATTAQKYELSGNSSSNRASSVNDRNTPQQGAASPVKKQNGWVKERARLWEAGTPVSGSNNTTATATATTNQKSHLAPIIPPINRSHLTATGQHSSSASSSNNRSSNNNTRVSSQARNKQQADINEEEWVPMQTETRTRAAMAPHPPQQQQQQGGGTRVARPLQQHQQQQMMAVGAGLRAMPPPAVPATTFPKANMRVAAVPDASKEVSSSAASAGVKNVPPPPRASTSAVPAPRGAQQAPAATTATAARTTPRLSREEDGLKGLQLHTHTHTHTVETSLELISPQARRVRLNATDTSALPSMQTSLEFSNGSLLPPVIGGSSTSCLHTWQANAQLFMHPNPEQQQSTTTTSRRPHAKQWYPKRTCSKQHLAAAEMGGEAVEMDVFLHSLMPLLRHRNRPVQLAYPADIPLDKATMPQRTRRPRTPRSFYGPKMPAVGKDWFRDAMKDARTVDSPDLSILEKYDDKSKMRGRPDPRRR